MVSTQQFRIKEIKSKNIWEDFLAVIENKTFLQSWNWGEFQEMMGRKIWRLGAYGVRDSDSDLLGVTLVVKIQAKRGKFLFVSHGPVLAENSSLPVGRELFSAILEKVKKIAKEENCSFIRIAPICERNEENAKIFRDLGFRQAPIHMHPELTRQLDLSPSEEELLMDMRKTTRYLIKQGLKDKNLEIKKSQDVKALEIFEKIYKETAWRHRFVPFSQKYLKNEFLAFSKDNEALIFLAEYKEKPIAAAIVIFWQGIAFYHQGASSQKYSKIPASYLLQWEVIKEAKKRGCKTYNLWGIAPFLNKSRNGNPKSEIRWTRSGLPVGLHPKQILNSKSQILSPKHPWAGLTLFKTGFGGYAKAYIKTQDLPLSWKYWLTYVFEKLRKTKRRL